jgi:hypothetical protein
MRAQESAMRAVILLGYLLGIAFPVLETMRRGFAHWGVNSTTMADDYIMGAVLLAACISWSLGMKSAKIFLVIAWAYVLGVMNAAFWGHLEGHLRGVVICDNNPAEFGAIVGKGVIWLIALGCLVVSTISLRAENATPRAAKAARA